MKFKQILKLSTRMFKARTSRTLLTVLGMSIGIGAILFLVSLGYGLQKTLLERITTSDSLLTLDVSEPKSGAVAIDKAMLDKISSRPGVDIVSPAFQMNGQGHFGDLSADLVAIGCDSSFLKLSGFKSTKGRLFGDDEPTGVVISSSMAEVFGKTADEMIGQEITFSYFLPKDPSNASDQSASKENDSVRVDSQNTYTIVGVTDAQENVVYIPMASLGDLNIAEYGQLKVKCRSSADIPAVRDGILQDGLLVSSLSDTVDQANQIFGILQAILMFFGVIALVVSAIGMFNTMTITLLERTEEIGIMKSIGATDRAISTMFFVESAIMGFLGGVSGVAIGWLGGMGFNVLINFIAAKLGGQKVSLFYSPLWFILSIIGFSVVVGIMTGFVPARRASKIDPLDALRYK
ncbi:MAG: ABC transporter permease [Candidatus Moraniibacteriota bacterium]